MSDDPETIVITIFETGAPPATVYRVHELLGMFDGPDPRVRFHSPELATFRVEGVDEALLDCLRGLPGVRKVVDLSANRRLYSKIAGSDRQPVVLPGA